MTILPGTTIIIDNSTSIYNGYRLFVQRIMEDKAAVLFDDYSPWEKLVTFPIKDLKVDTTGKQFYPMK